MQNNDVLSENKEDEIELLNIESEIKDDELTPLKYEISIYPADYTLEVLHHKRKIEEIEIPKFQRSYVWKIGQASKLIESFLMGLPIPPVFFFIQSNQKYLVIDGRQRLESVFRYFDGIWGDKEAETMRKFKLTGINPQSRFFGKGFQELAVEDQRRLKNAVLRVIVVKQVDPKNDHTSIYHIFERLNTGGTILHDQEVRNCIYAGKLNDLMVELNKYKNWRKILGKPNPESRQKDIGLILRYMALLHDIGAYSKPMKDFLSDFMSVHRDPPTNVLMEEEERFKKTCDVLIDKIGERPFNPKGAMNPSMFDAIFVSFAKNLQNVPSNIKERFCELIENSQFLKMTSDATTDVDVVKSRLELAENKLFR